MIKISSLWKNPKFKSLDDTSKLLYIYLATIPSLTTLGICCLTIDVIQLELSKTFDEVRRATVVLVGKGFISVQNSPDGVYFAVLNHFMTLPKTESLAKKALQELETLPEKLKEALSSNIDIDKKIIKFSEPSEQDVLDYAVSKGFMVNAKDFIDYYRRMAEQFGKSSGWYDSRGKQVKNWQGKLTKVWCKDENKLKKCEDAPKGYEYFHAVLNGRIVYPDYWKDGKPFSKEGLTTNKKLAEEYARKTSS